ncbi:unnamed protein product [Alopecurus aequalis]
MPSWPDSYSSEEMLGGISELDYAPDTVDDPAFFGLATDCSELCRVHQLQTRRCVAFEGTNTGRRFLPVENCGFVTWIDGEWPEPAKNALGRLWAMYEESNTARIDDRIEHGKFLKDLSDEKNKIEEKYTGLLGDVRKFMDETEKRVQRENNERIMKTGSIDGNVEELVKDRDLLKNKVAELEIAVDELKKIQKTQADVMKEKQNKWDAKKDALKEEKKTEYNIFKMINARSVHKEKLKKIRDICDE